jgi:acetyl esterase
VDLQVLVYPALDPGMSSRSYVELDGLALDRDEMAYFWNAFVPDEACRSHPDVDPFQADLAGLPPTLVLTAEFDVLRDEAESYAAALTAAGVACVHVRYQGMVHGFFRRLAKYEAAGVAVDQVAAMVRSVLEAKTGRSD